MADKQSGNSWVDMLEMRIQVRTGGTMPNGQQELGGRLQADFARVCISDPDTKETIPYDPINDPDTLGIVVVPAEGSYRPRGDFLRCYLTDSQGNRINPDDGSLEFGNGTFSASFTLPPPNGGVETANYTLTAEAYNKLTPNQVDASDSVPFTVDFTQQLEARRLNGAKQAEAGRRREGARAAQKG